jgi:diguanylate cyclase (GGDEF)-like protein
MVRFPSALPAPRRPVAVESLQGSRRLLRRLLDENVALLRELGDLRHMRRLAEQDALTGLPNRRLFDERLAEELSRSARGRIPARRGTATGHRMGPHNGANPRFGSLLVVDVNDLKLINDEQGHAAGDDLLRELAGVLRTTFRTSDMCCRTGGDEFMILLPDTDARGVGRARARVHAAVMRASSCRDMPVSVSVGCATWPADGSSASVLVEKADRAMYAEKRRQRRRASQRPTGTMFRCGLTLVK